MMGSFKKSLASLTLALVCATQPAWADCPTTDVHYPPADVEMGTRAIATTILAFRPRTLDLRYSELPTARVPAYESYCEWDKRPKVMPPPPIRSRAKLRFDATYRDANVEIRTNEGPDKKGEGYYWRQTQIHVITIGSPTAVPRGKVNGFTIIITPYFAEEILTPEQIVALEAMVDKAKLQAMVGAELPDLATAKAQLKAHTASLNEPPPKSATPVSASDSKAPSANPGNPSPKKKPKLPRILLPGLPRF